MQDGYYFATTPWMIGDGPQASADTSGITLVEDTSGLRRGQIVRIAHEPQADHDFAPIVAAPPPIILRETDRYTAAPVAAGAPDTSLASAALPQLLPQLLTELTARQDGALARIEQMFCASVAQLEDRVVAGLAAGMELARPHPAQNDRFDSALAQMAQSDATQAETVQGMGLAVDALAAKVEAIPRQSEALLRDVADIRAGLTELRVQARMIEMQLFAISRGTDNPLARPMGIEPLGAMLGDTYAS